MLHYLMRVYAQDMKCDLPAFHPDTLKMLEDYHWPGNVRELSNLLARLIILHPGTELGPEHVRPLLEQGQPLPLAPTTLPNMAVPSTPVRKRQENGPSDHSALADVEKAHIEHILSLTRGRVSGNQGAARLLGLPRSTLQYKLRKHGIMPQDFMKRA
jgi:DNA-binding NtrC family response regulator